MDTIRGRERWHKALRHTLVEERECFLEFCKPIKPSDDVQSGEISRRVHSAYRKFALQTKTVDINHSQQASRYEAMKVRRTLRLSVQWTARIETQTKRQQEMSELSSIACNKRAKKLANAEGESMMVRWITEHHLPIDPPCYLVR